MSVRIVSDTEVKEALRNNDSRRKDREYALEELDMLCQWCLWKCGELAFNEEFTASLRQDGPRFPVELIDEIKRVIEDSWPEPLTAADLDC